MKLFEEFIISELLPPFCRRYGFDTKNFDYSSMLGFSKNDKYNFLNAIQSGVVHHENGGFCAGHGGAEEFIFLHGANCAILRESIVAIGTAWRLASGFNWPVEKICLQQRISAQWDSTTYSARWPFDITALLNEKSESIAIACEAKKDQKEHDHLKNFLLEYSSAPLAIDARKLSLSGREENAYRKLLAIRHTLPKVIWLVAPNDVAEVFLVQPTFSTSFSLKNCSLNEIHFKNFTFLHSNN